MASSKITFRSITLVFGLVFVGIFVFLWATNLLPQINKQMIEQWIEQAGPWGPLLIVFLMIASIVASPIPSAPIAMISGAAYGHVTGGIYVAIGSEIGALTAFVIARYLGRIHVERWLGEKETKGLLGSQNFLMLTVFGSRLLPFISFDAMSYAAGLSRLRLWRFLIATLAGILPASFVLAHLGSETMAGEFGKSAWIIIGLGLMTTVPLLVAALWRRIKGTKS
tara:strand:+ start:1007 stop:1678 length:672 start_codon:yes stop_codon:yes gene_type:complete